MGRSNKHKQAVKGLPEGVELRDSDHVQDAILDIVRIAGQMILDLSATVKAQKQRIADLETQLNVRDTTHR